MPILDAFPDNLEDDVIVFRVIRYSWFEEETDELKDIAFIRRPNDTAGLSVNNTQSNASESLHNPNAVVSLLVESVRALDLDIIPTNTTHANITGLPSDAEINASRESKRIAQRLAGQLRKSATLVWRKPRV